MPLEKQYTKDDLIQELQRLAEENEGSITSELVREKSKVSMPTIYDRFDTINKAKKEAGIEIKPTQRSTVELSKEELLEDIKEKAKERKPYNKLSSTYYRKNGEYNRNTAVNKLNADSWDEVLEEAGLEPIKCGPYGITPGRKKVFKEWKKAVEDEYGYITKDKLVELINSKTDEKVEEMPKNNFKAFYEYLKEHTDVDAKRYRAGRKNGTAIWIDASMEERYDDYLDEIPDDCEEEFMTLIGRGLSPSTIVAAIKYVDQDKYDWDEEKTQREIAKEVGISAASLRNGKSFLLEIREEERDE